MWAKVYIKHIQLYVLCFYVFLKELFPFNVDKSVYKSYSTIFYVFMQF
jgi:hypothetical protein